MTRGRVITQLFLLTILLTVLIFSPSTPISLVKGEDDTDTILLPITNTSLPVIDGNETSFSQEWVNASKIFINVGGKDGFNGELYTQINGTHLFVMLNFTHEYIPVNDTVPTGSSLPYNNATHDWFAFEFDNDLRRNDYGTKDSPHDLVILNQYNTSAVDGFVYLNETDDQPVVFSDVSNNGQNNTAGTIGNITTYYDKKTIIEFYKEINSNDTNGHDVNIFDQLIISFRVLAWLNQSSTFNSSTALTSSWVNYRINETGTGFSINPVSNMTVYLDTRGANNYNDLKGFITLVKSYGIQLENYTGNDITLDDLNSKNLTILFLGDYNYKDDEITSYTEYFQNGGHLVVFVENKLSDSAKKLLQNFKLSLITGTILFGNVNNNGTDNIVENISNTNITVPFFKGASPTTDKKINSLLLPAAGLNTTDLKSTNKLFGQHYLSYDLLPIPNNVFLDLNENNYHDANETRPANLSLAIGLDLEYGGRLTIFSTSELVEKLSVLAEDNEYFLIRFIPWAAKFNGFLNIANTTTDKFDYKQGDQISIFTNVFKNNNDSNTQNVTVEILFEQAGVVLETLKMSFNNTSNATYNHYLFTSLTGKLKDVKGFLNIHVKAYQNGWGFAHQTTTIMIERIPPTFNQVNPWLIITFAIMVLIVVLLALFIYKKLRTE